MGRAAVRDMGTFLREEWREDRTSNSLMELASPLQHVPLDLLIRSSAHRRRGSKLEQGGLVTLGLKHVVASERLPRSRGAAAASLLHYEVAGATLFESLQGLDALVLLTRVEPLRSSQLECVGSIERYRLLVPSTQGATRLPRSSALGNHGRKRRRTRQHRRGHLSVALSKSDVCFLNQHNANASPPQAAAVRE